MQVGTPLKSHCRYGAQKHTHLAPIVIDIPFLHSFHPFMGRQESAVCVIAAGPPWPEETKKVKVKYDACVCTQHTRGLSARLSLTSVDRGVPVGLAGAQRYGSFSRAHVWMELIAIMMTHPAAGRSHNAQKPQNLCAQGCFLTP